MSNRQARRKRKSERIVVRVVTGNIEFKTREQVMAEGAMNVLFLGNKKARDAWKLAAGVAREAVKK